MGVILLSILVIAIAYVCGSLCSAIIVSQMFALPDPRTEGSHNPGATNVMRLAGKKYAALVLLGDMLKGLLPVMLARFLEVPDAVVGFTCLAAVVGHMYPVFFGFKGGKGVATALGAFLGLHFVMGVVLVATWLLVANISRYSSLASMVTITLAPLYAIVSSGNVNSFPALGIITILVLYQHRNNITRLIDGTEPELRIRHKQLSDLTDDILNKSIADDMEVSEKTSQAEEAPAATAGKKQEPGEKEQG
ncbi:glycerol-3-phosphate 1-O-acyltransferase PlsY [Legionella sp. CNM-4043-24]|uniref:glycerol-3-phosphate 1-O-acyltransferase PlsY n=1 Tax=Legionella sp. CNM-4043-24 TaxID=3421646 RepID=UPI00403AE436